MTGEVVTSELEDEDLVTLLAAVEGVVFDIDGSLILSSQPAGHDGSALPEAVRAVSEIRASGKPVLAFTNASTRPPEQIAASLAAFGFDFTGGEVLTPSVVAAEVVIQRFGDSPVLGFGGSGVVGVLRDAGVRLCEPGDGVRPAAVVVGWDASFDQSKLQAAAEALWAGAPLLVTSDAPAFATAGRRSAGAAGFIAAGLSHVGGVGYEVLGKPSVLAATAAAVRLGVSAERMLVVGDDLTLEVAMARRVGAVGVLVTTGMHSRTDARDAPPERRPHLVVDHLGQLAAALASADRQFSPGRHA